jgi:hypothetical protein
MGFLFFESESSSSEEEVPCDIEPPMQAASNANTPSAPDPPKASELPSLPSDDVEDEEYGEEYDVVEVKAEPVDSDSVAASTEVVVAEIFLSAVECKPSQENTFQDVLNVTAAASAGIPTVYPTTLVATAPVEIKSEATSFPLIVTSKKHTNQSSTIFVTRHFRIHVDPFQPHELENQTFDDIMHQPDGADRFFATLQKLRSTTFNKMKIAKNCQLSNKMRKDCTRSDWKLLIWKGKHKTVIRSEATLKKFVIDARSA